MCEPLTIAAGVMALGTGVQAYGQRQADKYNAAVAEQNAALAEESAEDALARGAVEESRFRVKARQFQGEQRAAIGSSGIEQSGSALRILADTAAITEMDAAQIRNNAAREAFGFRTQGLNFRAEARQQRNLSRIQPIGTVLSGAAQSYGLYASGG